jgi:hypothetical protein
MYSLDKEFTEEPVVGIHMGQIPLLKLSCIITYQMAIIKFTVAGSRIDHLLVLVVRSLKLIKNASTEEQKIKKHNLFPHLILPSNKKEKRIHLVSSSSFANSKQQTDGRQSSLRMLTD